MSRSRATGFAAFLVLVAACNGPDAISASVPARALNRAVAPVNGASAGRMLTKEEAIAFLEAQSQVDPKFLGAQRYFVANNKPDSTTFDAILEQLRLSKRRTSPSAPSEFIAGQIDNVTSDQAPTIVDAGTALFGAPVGQPALVIANMELSSLSFFVTLMEQTITTRGIGDDIVFPFSITIPQNPWTVSATMRFASPGTITSTTLHHAQNPLTGHAYASSSATAVITAS